MYHGPRKFVRTVRGWPDTFGWGLRAATNYSRYPVRTVRGRPVRVPGTYCTGCPRRTGPLSFFMVQTYETQLAPMGE